MKKIKRFSMSNYGICKYLQARRQLLSLGYHNITKTDILENMRNMR